ncbi:hypothetical protein ACWKWU_08045 [Chitinophaga lutea]
MKILFCALLAAALPAGAQDTSGVIEYEMTARLDASNLRIVRMGDGPAEPPPGMDIPEVLTLKTTLWFSGGKARLERESGPGMQFMSVSAEGGAAPRRRTLRPPVSNSSYIDLANRKTLSVVREQDDSGAVKGVWYAEEDFSAPPDLKLSEKTKTIAGYRCRRATARLGDEEFVLWYTTDLPMVFSPITGVTPEKGVVLSIESSKRSFVARKVELKPLSPGDVSLPPSAQKLTKDELKEKQRQIMEQFHNAQLEKLRP